MADADLGWTWSILLRDGMVYHLDKSVTLARCLTAFYDEGHQEADIVAIVRH